jgi:hypothetical protein
MVFQYGLFVFKHLARGQHHDYGYDYRKNQNKFCKVHLPPPAYIILLINAFVKSKGYFTKLLKKDKIEAMESKFKPKTIKGEYKLIVDDDKEFFMQTKEYLKPLILSILSYFELRPEIKTKLFWECVNDVPFAAKKYLENKNTKSKRDYKFSTYFTWFISQRINKIKHLKRKREDHH